MLPTRLVRLPRPKRRRSQPRGEVLDDPERRREESAESRQRVDGHWKSDRFEVNREELGRFDLKRAGLPDMSIESAAKYIDQHRASRPWLAMTDHAWPEARRIIAALDAAGGHAHIRHEGWVTEEANRRRVAYREDPAQLDPEKRELNIDGLRPNDPPHRCRTIATRIADPDAFATAFVRGVEHPRSARCWTGQRPGKRPDEVTIPITDLLGPDGDTSLHWMAARASRRKREDRAETRNKWIADKIRGARTGRSGAASGASVHFRRRRNRLRVHARTKPSSGMRLSRCSPACPAEIGRQIRLQNRAKGAARWHRFTGNVIRTARLPR